MSPLLYIILSGTIISILALTGIFALYIKQQVLDELLLILVALSAGTLIGGAFFHLLPEAIKEIPDFNIFPYVLIGYLTFFLIEQSLHWHHCHKGMHDKPTFHYMNLVGDAIHNFIDGLILAASYVISIPIGIATTLAVAAHEIPQEIGDFGVLVYGGFEKKKALLINFIVALSVILGGIIGYIIIQTAEQLALFLLPFAAGGFIYIAATDLLPEIRKEKDIKKSIILLEFFILGVLLMFVVNGIFHHAHHIH